jgi:predicted phosphate transport protein (TIGR00153 family)
VNAPAPRKRNTDFFTRFEEAAQNNIEAAHMLQEFCQDFTNAEEKVGRMHDLEHKGDEITHGVYEALNRTFMPPLDREDIIAIATALDNVMDHIYEAADAMCIYNIQAPTPVACSLVTVIVECTRQLALQLPKLRSRSSMRQLEEGVIEIHRLENEADMLLREGVKDLFHRLHDPIQVIAWSRIYETLERVTDECEEIADVLRGLVIKHA